MLNSHSKINKTKILMTNGSLMKVESIAECSPWTCIKRYLVLEPKFGHFESGLLTQVLLYPKKTLYQGIEPLRWQNYKMIQYMKQWIGEPCRTSICKTQLWHTLPYGPHCEKTCLWGVAKNTGANQIAHPHSLISAFVIRFLESFRCKLDTGEISIF